MLFLLPGYAGESAGGGRSEDTGGNDRFSEANVRELDSIIEELMQDENLSGVVVGVWVPGEGEYVVAKGEANLEIGREQEIDDSFRIANTTGPGAALTPTAVRASVLERLTR